MTNKILLLSIVFFVFSCAPTQNAVDEPYETASFEDGIIQFQFFHINDVYEIAPLEGGKVGGMARVSTVFEEAKTENPNTLFVHAGDFLNPSLLGTLKYQGERIKGKQMVEILNEVGLDVVTFGNHEFDLDEDELQSRLNESRFTWLGTNVLHNNGTYLEPFQRTSYGAKDFMPETYIWEIEDYDGTVIKIGLFGATINSNPKDYVYYEDYYQEAKKAYLELVAKTDVVFGLTHLEMVQDMKLASMLPNVPLFMGGHDHDNIIDTVGNVVIAKADANAKTVYLHRVTYFKQTGKYELSSTLIPITDEIEEDEDIAAIVKKWSKIQDAQISQVVENPYEVVYHATEPLDGRESSVRNFQSNLAEMVTSGIMAAAKNKLDCAILNGGSIRIDDQLEGDILAIDLFRAMPFGGQVWEIQMKGSLLKKILVQGVENKGIGGYLQRKNIEYNEANKSWKINGKALSTSRSYWVGMNNFLMTGLESGLDFLTKDNPSIIKIDKPKEGDNNDARIDIRKATIAYMKTL